MTEDYEKVMQYDTNWYKLIQIGKQDVPWKYLWGEIFKENKSAIKEILHNIQGDEDSYDL